MQLYAFSVLQTLYSAAIFFLKCSIKKLHEINKYRPQPSN